MRKIILILIITQFSLVHYGQIIADHRVVADYDKIPAEYIAQVKKMLVWMAGESHAYGYRSGLSELEALNPTYDISTGWGFPAHYDDLHLRVAAWPTSGIGEKDWFTWKAYPEGSLPAASTTFKTYIQDQKNSNNPINVLGFAWCWDMVAENGATTGIDPVLGVHWYGASDGGPDGNNHWGLNAEDKSITGNSVSMDTYLEATEDYIAYCAANYPETKVVFTTGPVDSYIDEGGYQLSLKNQYIRDYVANNSARVLFDYADILCYDDNGSQTTTTWNGHTYPVITETNLGIADIGHIGSAGRIRLAKAMWWMLARIAGWDGSTGGVDTTPPSIPSGLHVTSASSGSVSIAWNPSTDNTGVTGYRIYRGGIFQATSNTADYTDNTITNCNPYNYTVSAFDAEDNQSTVSSVLSFSKTPATPLANITQPTCAVYTGAIQITAPTGTGIEYSINSGVSWNSSTYFTLLTANTSYTISVRNTTIDPGCISNGNFMIDPIPPSPSAPTISNSSPVNICPETTINLTSLITSNTPTGGTVLYKTTNNILGANVANPSSVGTGNYYIFYQNQSGCYSTGTLVSFNPTICPPDVTPTLIVSPNIIHGETNFNVIVRVSELNMINTNGLITVTIPKDTKWTPSEGYNPSLTQLGSTTLNNNLWTYSNDAINHIFTSSTAIPNGGFSVFGFQVTFNPDNSRGNYTITSQIISGGGGEIRVSNNVDSERIDYFQE